jgi:hypothetical protein
MDQGSKVIRGFGIWLNFMLTRSYKVSN